MPKEVVSTVACCRCLSLSLVFCCRQEEWAPIVGEMEVEVEVKDGDEVLRWFPCVEEGGAQREQEVGAAYRAPEEEILIWNLHTP